MFPSGTDDLTYSATYGKCNVVYVGITVTAEQKAQLQDYSSTFRARIVYFNAAETANDPEVNSRLGISQDFTEPLVSAPFISLASEFGLPWFGCLVCLSREREPLREREKDREIYILCTAAAAKRTCRLACPP